MTKTLFLSTLLFLSAATAPASHPISLALTLIGFCVISSFLIFSFSHSWFFFLLVLMFLGGVMIMIIYMASLAANEKNFFYAPPTKLLLFIFLGFTLFDSQYLSEASSSFSLPKILFETENFNLLLFCFLSLLIVLISVVKLLKIESGPLSKRLLKPNLK